MLEYIAWGALGLICGLVGVVLVWLLLLGLVAALLGIRSDEVQNSRLIRIMVKPILWTLNALSGARVQTVGLEKLPSVGRFLLICNHRSNFDPLITLQILWERDLAFISKPSVFRIPIIGLAIRRCGFMAINRENPREAMKTINLAAKLLKSDKASVAVYPEGTRSKSGKLLDFHCGVLKIAQKANVPVVVTTLKGAENLKSNFPFKRTDINFEVLEVIPAERVKAERSTDLGEYCHSLIAKALGDE